MINFLAELSLRFDNEIHLTPSNSFPRNKNIYEIDINSEPYESYWTDWGGGYDNFQGNRIELYISQFLRIAQTKEEMLRTPYSLFLNADLICFVNIPNHPWLYPRQSIEAQKVDYFLYAALNQDKPSQNIIRGKNAKIILSMPDFTVKLSENINGIVLKQSFSASFVNNNSHFDNEELWNVFNTPIHIKKSIVNNPAYEDFKTIRTGIIEDTQTGFDGFSVTASDRLRAMNEPACEIVTEDKFPGIELLEGCLNKNIPIIYGTKRIKPLKIHDIPQMEPLPPNYDAKAVYLIAEYVSKINGVFDSEGNSLAYTFNSENMTITTSTKIDIAHVTGYPENKIGEIIKDLISRNTAIQYTEVDWNTGEVKAYTDTSYRVNIIIEGDNINQAVQKILKNDMAYFIQQSDGRFTIRKYGVEYNTHYIKTWTVTKKPDKTWGSAHDKYFSSCIINYGFTDKNNFKSLLYNEREAQAEDTYRRRVTKTFDTDLIDKKDVEELAQTLADRFTIMKQTLKVPVGADTSGYELLDRVVFNANINDRKFSRGEYFIIKEINPAQDILTLEEIDIYDIDGLYADSTDDDYEYDIDNLYADSTDDDFKYIVEGGTG